MTVTVDSASLDLAQYVRRGDHIVLGQACGEPTVLVEALLDQAASIGDLTVFIATSFSGLLQPDRCKGLTLTSMGAIGSLRSMAKANRLSVIPVHVGQVGPLIEAGVIPCDVAMLQLSPADENGQHSCSLIADHARAAAEKARTVIAEVNEQTPFTMGETIPAGMIDIAVPTSHVPVEVPPAPISETDKLIAGNAAQYFHDGSVIQTGVGSIPDAILRQLTGLRDLGVHSGMLGDGLVDLIEAGVVTNARKSIDKAVSINGALIGTNRLYRWAHRNSALRMCAGTYTHADAVLARVEGLVSINSAVEVDLTGQINAEQNGSTYLGGTGGQVDFVRAGARSPGGRSLVAMPATARGGSVSRITAALSGPVTTARSDVDVIVTEFGAAELKGVSLAERARRLVAIAHPNFREELDREAQAIRHRGF